MKLKDFKKLNENWDNWRTGEQVQEENKTYVYDGGGDAVYFAEDLGFEYEDEDEEDFDELEAMAIDFIKSKGYTVVGYDDDSMQEGKKNCGCGQDPCVTYGTQNESVKQVSEQRYQFARGIEQLDVQEDPRVQAFKQCIDILGDLTYDSLEDDVASYVDEAARSLFRAAEELDYKRNKVGNIEERIKKTIMRKLQEKAKSKNQQQFMGMVKKCQDTGDCASAEVKKAADSMKKTDVKDFASTKHKGLPNKVEDKK